MIYIDNITGITQTIYIPRDEAPERVYPGGGSYESGFTDGRNYQKSLLTGGTFTENGDYTRENGWSAITVDVDTQGDYDQGYADGVAWRDAQDIPGVFYENGTYHRENGYGWNEVNVRVDTASTFQEGYSSGYTDGYSSGHTQGETDQKAKLKSIAIYANGVYSDEDGYDVVSVEVPQTGYTESDLISAYDAGYEAGYNDGFNDALAGNKYIKLSVNAINANSGSAGYSLSVTANTDWTIVERPAWAWLGNTPTPDSGHSGVTTGSIFVNYNSGDTRVGVLKFSGSTATANLVVKQVGAETHYEREYLTIEMLEDNSIFSYDSHSHPIEISINDGEWTTIGNNNTIYKYTATTGDYIRLRGNNTSYYGARINNYLISTQRSKNRIYGNIMSLIHGANFENNTELPTTADSNFRGLFRFSKVVDLSGLVLPSLTLTNSCYKDMFEGCTELFFPPVLPATTLADDCYGRMFLGCYSLLSTPSLPVTSLRDGCYQGMFADCPNITTAPALPSTTLTPSCYTEMFYGCSSLTQAPELLARTLEDDCYYRMFYNCNKLNAVKCLAENPTNDALKQWLVGVSVTGTFTKLASANWEYGEDGIPYGWTVIDNN